MFGHSGTRFSHQDYTQALGRSQLRRIEARFERKLSISNLITFQGATWVTFITACTAPPKFALPDPANNLMHETN